jgi:hypothetical protein
MGIRYVRPETTILPISQGDTLTVKKRLTHGERSAAYARQYAPGPDGLLHTVPEQIKLSMVTAYLIDWSITGLDGNQVAILGEPIEVVEAALNGLSPEDFDEIHAAIDKHEKAMRAERVREKKQKGPTPAVEVTSPSLLDAAGASTGSVS